MSFSQRLRTLRAEHNMTQKELAKRINVSRTTITGYETKNRQPSHEKLMAMADIFGVSVDYLIDGAEAPISLSLSQHERILDEKMLRLYAHLTIASKEAALDYMELLKLREEKQAQEHS
ncbi:helix-turn-helix domain-containing protein [Mordavella massiliensis]|uniref:Helix-turn-helix transcriptional regulator n=1 Tax=Mordavella massiliensis TaxID=1871024 RepID=A0A938XDC3_9CLOT|nr:helix-turn-helix transcriptional regulator [Mordavella massiliensis]MBM6948972.1 helix-turn-helix transcriptional regulator [Mordavella massiliensis]